MDVGAKASNSRQECHLEPGAVVVEKGPSSSLRRRRRFRVRGRHL
jgi:hypothetical protein